MGDCIPVLPISTVPNEVAGEWIHLRTKSTGHHCSKTYFTLSLSIFLLILPIHHSLLTLFLSLLLPCAVYVCTLLFILSPLFTWCFIHQSPSLPNRQSSSPHPALSHMYDPQGNPICPYPPSILSVPLSLIFPCLCLHTRSLSYTFSCPLHIISISNICFTSSQSSYFITFLLRVFLSASYSITNHKFCSHALIPSSYSCLFISLLVH